MRSQRMTPEGKALLRKRILAQEDYMEGIVEEPYRGPLNNPVPSRTSAKRIHAPNPVTNPIRGKTTTEQVRKVQHTPYAAIDQGYGRVRVQKKERRKSGAGSRIITIALLLLVLGFSGSVVLNWDGDRLADLQYGRPRTFQTDFVVGHNNDSDFAKSHFIALNLNGQIEIIEIPGGDGSKAVSYVGPNIVNSNIQIRLKFVDVNDDQKPDMVIEIEDGSNKVMIWPNTGQKFDPKGKVPHTAVQKLK
jgi:hypothetical protein